MWRVLAVISFLALLGIPCGVAGASELPPEPLHAMPASSVVEASAWLPPDRDEVRSAAYRSSRDETDDSVEPASYDRPATYERYEPSPRGMDDPAVRPAGFRFGRLAETSMTPPDTFGELVGEGWPEEAWSWQVLPPGLMFRSYLAGGRESRFGSQWIHERNQGWLWDVTLGGRVGMLRWGTTDPVWPQGWQVDIEGAAFPRLSLEENRDLVSADFRFGIPITFRQGRFEAKFAYYHLSSHLGDEYELTHPWLDRINYSRDALVWAVAVYPLPNVRTYAEAGWAFTRDGGSQPWEFQFGVDYSPLQPTGPRGAPFLAVNGRIREEVDYAGNVTFETGWQWRGETGRLARVGFYYFNGMSDQYQFFLQHEEQIGIGTWMDF